MTSKQTSKIALQGQEYASPKTESVVVINQGVLCSSGGSAIKSWNNGGTL